MTNLSELARRCEEGEGGDRELWSDILCALVGVDAADAKRWYGSGRSFLVCLDEAVSFVERALPGWLWGVRQESDGIFIAHIWRGSVDARGEAPSPARAVMTAALRALSPTTAEETRHD